MLEAYHPQVFKAAALLLGDREDHGIGKAGILVAMHRHGAIGAGQIGVLEFDRGGERVLRPQRERAVRLGDAFAKGDRTDVPLAYGPQRHDEPHRAAVHARLVRMRHDRRVHQRGGRIRVFVAEIGPDQVLARERKPVRINPQLVLYLAVADLEHLLGLPVPFLEIGKHAPVFGAGLPLGKSGNVLHQPRRPVPLRSRCLPPQMEWPQDDAGRISVKPGIKDSQGIGRSFSIPAQVILPISPPRVSRRPTRLAWNCERVERPESTQPHNSRSDRAG